MHSYKLDCIKTLQVLINNGSKFDKHIKGRTQKTIMAYQTMARLQNTKGGITRLATGNIYNNLVRAISTYAAEIWQRQTDKHDYDPRYLPMQRLEDQALRLITGAYNGSNQ